MPDAPAVAPEAPTAAAPAAPAAAPPVPEIHVTPTTVVDQGPAQPPPKPGSARDKMFGELRKKAAASETPPAAKPVDKSKDQPQRPGEAPAEPGTETAPKAGAAAEDKKKANPWKLVDQYKSRATQLETEIAQLRKSVPDPKSLESEKARIAAMEKRAQELEEEIRFTNYAKSQEYQEKYQKPYEEQWKRAMNDLSELTLRDADTGEERPITPKDLLDLVNKPLQEARARANELYGDFADDVMAHRKEIRRMFDEQNRALEEARKNAQSREEQIQRQFSEVREKMTQHITETWQKANDFFVKDEKRGHLFRPADGDEEGNQRLAKGYEMADKAFSVNPLDPRLTPEQRADIVKLHAAVRNRAAAFGRLLFQHEKLQADLKAAKDELDKYRGVQPPAASSGKPPESAAGPGSAHDQIFGSLRKLAH